MVVDRPLADDTGGRPRIWLPTSFYVRISSCNLPESATRLSKIFQTKTQRLG